MERENRIMVKEGQCLWLDEPGQVLNIFSAAVEIYAVDLNETSANRVYIVSLGANETFFGAEPHTISHLKFQYKIG